MGYMAFGYVECNLMLVTRLFLVKKKKSQELNEIKSSVW